MAMHLSIAALERRVNELERSNGDLGVRCGYLSQEIVDIQEQTSKPRVTFALPANDEDDVDDVHSDPPVDGSAVTQVPRTREENECLIQDALRQLPADCSMIIAKLVREVSPPVAEVGKKYDRGHILFPANMVNVVSKELCATDQSSSSMLIMLSTLDTIRQVVATLQGDDLITGGAFWLSNAYQIYLGLLSIDSDTDMGEISMRGAKRDAKVVVTSAYKRWIREVSRLCDRLYEAIVEEQAIPGFKDDIHPTTKAPLHKVQDILNLFTRVHTIMKAFYFEDHCLVECMDEIVKVTMDKAFNNLIVRNSFLTSKRAVQITHNITQIKEWCSTHDVQEGRGSVERILQAATFLLLHKQYQEDIERLCNQCFLLKPVQVHSLLLRYCPADSEPAVSAKVISKVAKRLKQQTQADALLRVSDPGNASFIGTDTMLALLVRSLETNYFLPKEIDLPQVRHLFELLQSRIQDEAPELYTLASPNSEPEPTEPETPEIESLQPEPVVADPLALLSEPLAVAADPAGTH